MRSIHWRARRLLDRSPRLRVHSAFTNALNLETPGGHLLALVGPTARNAPMALVLADTPQDGFEALELPAAAEAQVSSESLRVGRLSLEWRSASTWYPQPLPEITENLDRRTAIARELVLSASPTEGLGPLLQWLSDCTRGGSPPSWLSTMMRRGWAGVGGLIAAVKSGDSSLAASATENLVGLGPGLTPSGDDVLAGFLVACQVRRPAEGRKIGRACAAFARGRTTTYGQERVRFAARGEIEELQLEALRACIAGTDEDIRRNVRQAARWGHSSGTDTLAGLLFGLTA